MKDFDEKLERLILESGYTKMEVLYSIDVPSFEEWKAKMEIDYLHRQGDDDMSKIDWIKKQVKQRYEDIN